MKKLLFSITIALLAAQPMLAERITVRQETEQEAKTTKQKVIKAAKIAGYGLEVIFPIAQLFSRNTAYVLGYGWDYNVKISPLQSFKEELKLHQSLWITETGKMNKVNGAFKGGSQYGLYIACFAHGTYGLYKELKPFAKTRTK